MADGRYCIELAARPRITSPGAISCCSYCNQGVVTPWLLGSLAQDRSQQIGSGQRQNPMGQEPSSLHPSAYQLLSLALS